MLASIPVYIFYLAAIALSAIISAYSVRKIIFITKNHKIYDVPDDIRKIHGAEIPSLGGIGIFVGYVIVSAFFWPHTHFFMPYVLASSAILFFTGIYDDIMNMRPSKKLIAQLIASLITVIFAHIRIGSLYGLFGIDILPWWPDVILSTLCCTFFINVFNFVDGIDGLAGVLAVMYMLMLGVLFAYTKHQAVAGISFALAGATVGLLFFNIAPAKIYMGDTGSMFLGFTIFIFSLLFLNWFGKQGKFDITCIHGPQKALLLVFAMLFLPIFDAIRVFILRASRGVSPLKADRTHLHYYLLDAGFTHTQSVIVIVGTNIAIIVLAFLMQDMNPYLILVCITLLASLVLFIVYRLRQGKLRK
jgi:UDP-N-acetylmuramyl pentapeptide phosphotransferase/UDP-N-acetylglucosamine-1-phosphate transferase